MSGVTFSDSELRLLRERTFYKSTGDRFPYSPRAYDRSDEIAATFIADPTSYIVTASVETTDPTGGEYLLAGAFKYLIERNTTYGNAVKTQLLAQILETGTTYSSFTTLGTGSDTVSFSAEWVAQLFNSYDYTKDLFTVSERADMDSWFYEAANFFQRSLNQRIFIGRFPLRSEHLRYETTSSLLTGQTNQIKGCYYYNRETNLNYEFNGVSTGSISDYTPRTTAKRQYDPAESYVNQAAMIADQGNQVSGEVYYYTGLSATHGYIYEGTTTGTIADYTYHQIRATDIQTPVSYDPISYTHFDSGGTPHNELYTYMAYYKNPMGMMVNVLSLVGSHLNDELMLDHARLWVEELLKYATFPDGTFSEYRRNGDYGVPQQGAMYYGIIVLEAVVLTAEVFRRRGDNSLYEFATTVGLNGTEGGVKNIKRLLDTVVENCTGSVLRYYSGVTESYLLDTLNGTVRFLPETVLAMANQYYDDPILKATYLLDNATNPYGPGYTYPTGGNITQFGGPINIWPAAYFQWYELEPRNTTGLLYDIYEVNIWKDRIVNGPYKTTSDRYTTSPGSWDDIVTLADAQYNGTMSIPADIWDSNDITSGYADTGNTISTNAIGRYTVATAFYYLLSGDTKYGYVAKDAILAQVRNYNPHFEDYDTLARNLVSDGFHFAGVATRFLLAFDYCKDLFTDSEILEVETWMERCYNMCLYWAEYYPTSNYPQRLNRIYMDDEAPTYSGTTTYNLGDQVRTDSTNIWMSLQNGNIGNTPAENSWWTKVGGNYAASGQQIYDDSNPKSWTHMDSGGTYQNRIYRTGYDYSNQDNLLMLFNGLWAVYKNDSAKIDRVKIYFEEYIKFSVFPDGMVAENYRNDNATIPQWAQLGCMWYGVIAMECYILFAEALRRTGDESMYAYTTSDGIRTTVGGPKNIKLVLDTLITNITSSVERYYSGITADNRLDPTGGAGGTYRYTPELIYGIANRYFKDDTYRDTYLLNNANSDYTNNGPLYTANTRWSLNVGVIPSVPFYNETETFIGTTFTSEEETIWRDRSLNGPYKTQGDRFFNSPNAWNDVVDRANQFMNDSVNEYWDGNFTGGWADSGQTQLTNTIGHFYCAAGFYYLIKRDATYGIKARDAVLAQCANTTNPYYEDYYSQTYISSIGDGFHMAGVLMRMLLTYDYTKDLWTNEQVATLTTYMNRAAPCFLAHFEIFVTLNFPNRLSDDYDTTSWWALTGQKTFSVSGDSDPSGWTHTNAAGVPTNRIYLVHTQALNANMSTAAFYGMWAIFKNDQTAIDRVKRFYKEFMTYSIFPDGMPAENYRSDTGTHKRVLGNMWYFPIMLEAYMLIAEMLRRNGDDELYTFAPTAGIWGNEGLKTLEIALDTLVSNIANTTSRYFDTVAPENIIGVMGDGTYRYKPEMAIGIADGYFNKPLYKSTYLLENATDPYPLTWQGPAYAGEESQWEGALGVLPAVPLMNYEILYPDVSIPPIIEYYYTRRNLLFV